VAAAAQGQAPPAPWNPTVADTERTNAGDLKITPVQHASVMLEFAGKTIHVDPVGDYSRMNKPADLILITDIHGDHMNANAVNQLKKAGTVIITPAEVAKTITDARVINNGQTQTINVAGTNIQIEAVPAYNLTRGPQPGQLYHTKGRGNGYVLTLGGKRVYMSGDTECVPEIKALRNIDIAFLPMNLPFTQTAEEAAECVKSFRPKVIYPYHYRGMDLAPLSAGLRGENGIELRQRNWY
jgi:L-ascorbate metabolism protein UlaG (beta-lactamase superfamily)